MTANNPLSPPTPAFHPFSLRGLSGLVAVLCTTAAMAPASVLYLSTKATENIGGIVGLLNGDIARYESSDPSQVAYDGAVWSDSGSVSFAERDHYRKSDGSLGAEANTFAFHVLTGGELILTASGTERLGTGSPSDHLRDGGSQFDPRDLVRYAPVTQAVSLFMDGSLAFRKASNGETGADARIDAVSLLSNDNILLSTAGNEILGQAGSQVTMRPGDLVAYNPMTDTASLYFNQDKFRTNTGALGASADIDAVHVLDNGQVILSANAAARLGTNDPSLHMRDGGSKFDDQDLVLYDPVTDTASLYFDGRNFRTAGAGEPGGAAEIDGVALPAIAVPEPASCLLVLVALLGRGLVGRIRRRVAGRS